MKKAIVAIILSLLLVGLLLTSCANTNINTNPNPNMPLTAKPLFFYNMEDVRRWVKTASLNFDDYSKEMPPVFLHTLYKIDKEQFLDIDLLFPLQNELSENLKYFLISTWREIDKEFGTGVRFYRYFFNNNTSITVYPGIRGSSVQDRIANIPAEDIRDVPLSEALETSQRDEFIVNKVGDHTLLYRIHHHQGGIGVSLELCVDGFMITITAPIAALFTDGEERERAFMQLVDAIENRPYRDMG